MSDGYHYTGGPNECDIHWPVKLIDGECPVHEFPVDWQDFLYVMFTWILPWSPWFASYSEWDQDDWRSEKPTWTPPTIRTINVPRPEDA